MGQKTQTVIFSKDKGDWTLSKARKWLEDHDLHSEKVDETEHSWRFRQFPPSDCEEGSFKTLTEGFPAGLSMVVCEVEDSSCLPCSPARRDEIELRHFPMELRLAGDDEAPVLEGHIAVFNKLSEDLGGFREKIEPGAFADSIGRDDIRALWNHQNDLVLGRTSAGTLELSEDKRGLAFKNNPPDTAWFRDRMVSLKRKDVTGASFGFITEVDEWSGKEEKKIRTLKKIRLIEVSPGVTFPAYPQTGVALRSMERWIKAEEESVKKKVEKTPEALLELDLKKRRLRLHELTLR